MLLLSGSPHPKRGAEQLQPEDWQLWGAIHFPTGHRAGGAQLASKDPGRALGSPSLCVEEAPGQGQTGLSPGGSWVGRVPDRDRTLHLLRVCRHLFREMPPC